MTRQQSEVLVHSTKKKGEETERKRKKKKPEKRIKIKEKKGVHPWSRSMHYKSNTMETIREEGRLGRGVLWDIGDRLDPRWRPIHFRKLLCRCRWPWTFCFVLPINVHKEHSQQSHCHKIYLAKTILEKVTHRHVRIELYFGHSCHICCFKGEGFCIEVCGKQKSFSAPWDLFCCSISNGH